MNRKEIKDFLETLHFHGYINHDITKLENLIDDYYPKQLQQADVTETVCILCNGSGEYRIGGSFGGAEFVRKCSCR